MRAGARQKNNRTLRAEDSAEVLIHDLDDQGRGVARLGGKVTFIEGALTGERVRVRPRKRRRRFDEADLVRIVQASPDRTEPGCAHFSMCGGCRLQHLSAPAQRRRKVRTLEQTLARHGLPSPGVMLEPLFGEVAGYRRKARLGVRYVPGKGGAMVGFREKRSNFVADLVGCEVLVPAVGERLPPLRALVSSLDARDRIPQIEVAAGDSATALVFRHLDPLSASDASAIADFGERFGIQIYLQPGAPDSVVPLWPETPPPLTYALPEFGLELAFRPTDFVQVNAAVNRQLVTRAVELLELRSSDRVLDLFCGIGNFSLAMARRAATVTGIEYGADMVDAAERNADRNGIANVSFERRDLDDAETAADWMSRCWDKLLLDPPRSGAASVVGALRAPYPERVVYVSCNPESFARDAAQLVGAHGYRFEKAGIVDMFPHTAHVEVVGLFSRRATGLR
ncbi:MAG: 23S rRNA (uracil(1939)-C(5))-methyltransferase RlmD [Gammaproteobacteria bacterium]|nr:23S rRNA (uracil(1939)-C(5))-methyltransferase RlmD [Gammaproteobacteria bacterium]